MNNLIAKERTVTLDSREVAEMVGKQHSNLLRDIETYIQYLGQNSNLSSDEFFIESSYQAGTGKEYKCYQVTKKGCEFIAHKLTGQKGAIFTATYINKFHEMEQKLATSVLPTGVQAIKLVNQQVGMLVGEVESIQNRVSSLENNMTIDYAQQENLSTRARMKIVQALGGKDTPAYQKLSKKAFSLFWRDYKRYMNVASYKDTPVKEIDKAYKFIDNWVPTSELELMILGANSQMRMVKV
ncbi:ORF6C domain-containing protein [Anaerophilus nitritogenes]|uniref:ORF6C domain-containing protein n=1 Tax=Anaerophilus nitritogenes TaxID=2498136 RepID=UPI00101BF4A8|nr:ORF6C domain-containing protein [Anaerophilus nitritogenes]